MKALKFLGSILVFSALFACNNYTAAPVCSDQNAVVPPGLTGVYVIATQREDFSAEVQEISVGVDSAGHMKTHGLRADGDDDSRVCEVNGYYVQENYNDKAKGYVQSRLYVTGMGLTTAPLFYDKAGLDAAGIPSSTFDVPEGVAKVMGPVATHAIKRITAKLLDEQPTLGLMIDNSSVYPEAVMARSYPAPVGLTLFRK